MHRSIVVALLLASMPAQADVALVLTDLERARMIATLGAALAADPSQQRSSEIVYLLNKLNTAPLVQSQTKVEPPKPDDKPADAPKEGQNP